MTGLVSGTDIKRFDYDPYGNQISADESENPYRYCGEYTDFETGYVYLRARYYDPSIGGFVSVDPAKDGGNWYAYCAGNPVNAWDPSGLYNVDKALSYAKQWWNGRNPKYYSYTTDCSNFVSQCLYAGGIGMTGKGANSGWHSYRKGGTPKYNLKDRLKMRLQPKLTEPQQNNLRYNWDVSDSWRMVKWLKGWVSAECDYVLNINSLEGLNTFLEKGAIQSGDVAFISTNCDGKLNHAILVGKITSDNIYYFGHTNNRNGNDTSKSTGYGFKEYFSQKKAKKKNKKPYILVCRMQEWR